MPGILCAPENPASEKRSAQKNRAITENISADAYWPPKGTALAQKK
jgi:hypothetical protein